MIAAGKLLERITVQVRNNKDDATFGEPIPDWKDSFTIWAEIRPMTATERLAHGQVEATVNYTIVTRYSKSVSEVNRLRWGTRLLNILGVMRSPDKAGLKIMAVEVKGGK